MPLPRSNFVLATLVCTFLATPARAEAPSVLLGANLAGGLDPDSYFLLLRPGLFLETRAGVVRLGIGASYGLTMMQGSSGAAHELRGDVSAAFGIPFGTAAFELGLGALGGATLASFSLNIPAIDLSASPTFGVKALAAVSASVGDRAVFRVALQPEGVWTWISAQSWLPPVIFDLRLLLVASFAWRLT